ncbi:MAG: MGDG synthase family glycosyltransferase [Blastocatellia bacterium]
MTPPFIVVLYACSGSRGHQALAENYCELLLSAGINAIAVDVLALDSHRRFSGFVTVYFWLLHKMPWLWRWLYQNWSNVPGINWYRQRMLPRQFRRTRHLLMMTAPELVLSTHPVSTAAADHLKRVGKLKAPLWVAISDWHTQPFWLFPSVDRYLVPTNSQHLDLERTGVPKNKMTVVGMLLRRAYYKPTDRNSARAHLKVPAGSHLIVVMGGGSGWGLENIIEALTRLESRLIVIAGSKERQMQIQLYMRKSAFDKAAEVLGYVDPLPYLIASDLVVTKPGALSTAEVLHLRRPLILTEPMPGHEEENSRILSTFGICCATTSEELVQLARAVLNNGGTVEGGILRVESICCDATPQLVLNNIRQALDRRLEMIGVQ